VSIARLSYVRCDGCGDPAQPADDHIEARQLAKLEGYVRKDGHDWCGRCWKLPDGQRPWDLDPPVVHMDAAQ
jgi:hypothetical protein